MYALLVSAFFYRDLTWTRIKTSIYTAGVATGVVMLLIMASTAAGWVLTIEEVPQQFLDWAKGNFTTTESVLLLMNIMMLVAGMFIDLPAAILMLTPLFLPLAQTFHIDLVQLGIIMVVNLAIGLYTPPVGTTLFIGSSIARVSIVHATRELWPYYIAAITVVVLFSYVPALTLR